MAAEGPPVLRFPISGKEDEFFLLEATSYGSKPLDLKLRGSEGSAVFAAKWHDIEIRAEVPPDASYVELCVRKNIHGITQRLGAVKLSENPDEEISPFNWCISTIAARVRAEEELAAATAKAQALESSVGELKDQLRELIQAKEDDETQLLVRFRDLLNEKKVKIRQQQRLMAVADGGSGGPGKGTGAGAGASRGSKRKAGGNDKDESTDEDDDGAFVKMEVDNNADSGGGPQLDPEDNDPETTDSEIMNDAATETESDGAASSPSASPPPAPKSRGKQAARGRTTRSATSKATTSKAGTSKTGKGAAEAKPAPPQNKTNDDDDELPPRRVIPFLKGSKAAAPPPPQPATDDDETESDDEL
ncbi:putative dna double-strand break repair and vj recombination xrcc4 protein [Eutypa lata UCREL1]|uniref:Putative dna double-strand break repair and vj recombination xrcc4 protein n=1 Tax=Eutypa lata (strain UCR-EL1) TaxID=1287681 RepID=M7SAV7_EUTLA|nr:putative dna double-strand break repair and vj recombination xrcc4 protein [Eutypa lata UCREL1]